MPLEFIFRKWYCFKFITYKNRDPSKKRHTSGLTKLLYVAPESLTKRKMSIFLKCDHFVAIDERIVSQSGVMISGRNTEI
jgi:superfamily II DNA helicase RecQ